MSIGDRIKQRREEMNITQEELVRMRSVVQIRLAALLLCPGTLVLVRFRALFIFTEIFIAV